MTLNSYPVLISILSKSPFIPPSPPELPTLYKRSITHFRSLFTLSRTLPTHRLFEKLKSQTSNTSTTTTEENTLKLGCRIGLGEAIEEKSGSRNQSGVIEEEQEQEIPLNKPLIEGQDDLQSHEFSDILTPIGNLKFKVTYRNNVDFSLYDPNDSNPMKEIEMDEDFFKPVVTSNTNTKSQPQAVPTPEIPSKSTIEPTKKSLLSTSADRKASLNSIPSASPIEQQPTSSPSNNRSSPVPSLFSTSAPGRPVAGLSNLRRTGSNTGAGGIGLNTTSNNNTTGSSTPPSPALAALGAADPAFLAHGRRASSSEKRMRTFSSISSEKVRGDVRESL